MANTYTPQDAYAIINEVVSQATGRDDLEAVDTSSFTSVAETVLSTGTENVLNSLTTVICKTIFSSRKYTGKFGIMKTAQERWGGIVRKIVPLYKEAVETKAYNNNLDAHVLEDGDSVDMYAINKPKCLQLNIVGTKIVTKSITKFLDQLSTAFKSESEFMTFIEAVMLEFANEVELITENEARLTMLNYVAGISSMGLTEVDLVAEFNAEYGTTYTREALLTTYFDNFLKFVISTIKVYSNRLTDMSTNYHANINGYEKIMRHTPKDKQRGIFYAPFFENARARVMSGVYNPEMLDIGAYESVNYWQSQNDPEKINIKPNILNTTTGASKTAESNVELDYVLGIIYDVEAMGITPQFEMSSVTPLNSKGLYYNMYLHTRFNSWCDFTENGILFVLGAGGE